MPKVIAEISFVPLGAAMSLSPYVAQAVKIIEESGLDYEFHAMGTNVEGEWEDIVRVIDKCHRKLFEMGVPRIQTSVRISLRRDKDPSIRLKKEHVKEIINEIKKG